MWIDTHGQAQKRVTSSWLIWDSYMRYNWVIWGSSSEFPLANHLALPVSDSIFGLIQGPPLCADASLSQNGFQHRGLWEGWHYLKWGGIPSLFDFQGPFLHMCSWEASLTSRMRNMWSLYLLSGKDSAPPCSCHYLYLGVSVHRGQIPTAQPGAHLSPVSIAILRHFNITSFCLFEYLECRYSSEKNYTIKKSNYYHS